MTWAKKRSTGGRGDKKPFLHELVDVAKIKDDWERVRAIGPMYSYGEHWFNTRKKDGEVSGNFSTPCLAYDPTTETFPHKCPYCQMANRPRIQFLQNVIDRKQQRKIANAKGPKPLPEETKIVTLWDGKTKGKLKSKDSESLTCVKVLRIPSSASKMISDLALLNVRADKKTGEEKAYGPDHPKYGFDLLLKYDGNASPASRYSIQRDEKTKLSETESAYALWNLNPSILALPSYEEAMVEAKRIGKYRVSKDKDGKWFDDPIDPETGKPPVEASEASEGSARSKKVKNKDIDLDDLDGVNNNQDDNHQEDEAPRKKKKRLKKSKKVKGADKSKAKAKKSKKSKSKKRRSSDELRV